MSADLITKELLGSYMTPSLVPFADIANSQIREAFGEYHKLQMQDLLNLHFQLRPLLEAENQPKEEKPAVVEDKVADQGNDNDVI